MGVAHATAAARYYAAQFRHVFGTSLERGVGAMGRRTSARSSRRNLEAIRTLSDDAVSRRHDAALGSVSRAYYDPDAKQIYAALQLSRASSRTSARSTSRPAPIAAARRRSRGPSIYTVTSLACDPDDATLFYTTDNSALRDLCGSIPCTRQDASC